MEYGGVDYPTNIVIVIVIVGERFAVDPGVGASGSSAGVESGTKAQREELRRPVAEGEPIMRGAISEPGSGFLHRMQFFDETRTAVATRGVGIAHSAAERALDYAHEREQWDRPIGESRLSSTRWRTYTPRPSPRAS